MTVGAIAAVVGTAVAAYGIYSGEQAADDAARASRLSAEEEARLEGILTDEKVRRLGVEREQVIGQQRAGYAGSGVEVGSSQRRPGEQIASGSVMDVLTETATEFAREISVTRETGASRATNALARGNMVAQNYQNQARANSIQTASSVFSFWAGRLG